MAQIHKKDDKGEILCKKVPNFSKSSNDWIKVTCKYCLKLKEVKS